MLFIFSLFFYDFLTKKFIIVHYFLDFFILLYLYIKYKVEYREMEEKYNQLEDENASDTSEKSKPGLVTPEKKVVPEVKKESDTSISQSVPTSSAPRIEVKEEDDQDSDHEDPHGKYLF